jgi:hypothetical protein
MKSSTVSGPTWRERAVYWISDLGDNSLSSNQEMPTSNTTITPRHAGTASKLQGVI